VVVELLAETLKPFVGRVNRRDAMRMLRLLRSTQDELISAGSLRTASLATAIALVEDTKGTIIDRGESPWCGDTLERQRTFVTIDSYAQLTAALDWLNLPTDDSDSAMRRGRDGPKMRILTRFDCCSALFVSPQLTPALSSPANVPAVIQ
jgi:hypothetical protein